MEGVAVSNGASIALTAKDGSYTLRVDPQRHTHVFVTVPSGWGSVGSFYRPLTEWLGGNRDFVLCRRARPDSKVRFAVVSDLHYGYPGTPANTVRWLAADLGRIRQAIPASQFLIAAGDLSEIGIIEQLTAMRKIFDGLDSPVFPLFGNHDGSAELKTHRSCPTPTPWPWFRNFLQTMGPAWYSFECGPCHFSIIVNEEAYLSNQARQAQRRWLLADVRLAKRRGLIAVVAAHAPPSPQVGRDLARRGVRLFIHGHWHCLRHYRLSSMDIIGIPSTTFGGIDMTPRAWLDIEIARGGSLKFRYVPLGPIFKSRPAKPKTKIVWRRKLADYFHVSGPTLADGRLFVIANYDTTGRGSSLLCLGAETGRTHWQTPLSAAVKHSPVLWWDRVYLTTQGGQVMCLSQKDGRSLWTRGLADHPHRWINNAPVVADNSIVAAGTLLGGLGGFDCRSGKRLWEIVPQVGQRSVLVRDTWPWNARPLALGQAMLIPSHGGGLSCIDTHSGQVKWQYDYRYCYYMPGPLLYGDFVWCPSPQPDAPNVQLDTKTGQCVRRVKFAGVPVSWTVEDASIYVTVLDQWVGGYGFLQRRSAKSGRLIWQQKLPRDPADAYHYLRNGPGCLAEPAVADDIVYQSCTDGTLRLFDAATGKPIAKLNLGSPLFAPPIIGPDRAWLTTWSGRLYCICR